MQLVGAIFSAVACPTVGYLSTLSHKWLDLREKKELTANKI
jgi:hypothetical protein